MSYPMSIAQMTEILGNLDATNCGDTEAVAYYLLNNLIGYRSKSVAVHNDAKMVAVIIQAYAKLLQDSGVKMI